jgi:triacylglycerol lipase
MGLDDPLLVLIMQPMKALGRYVVLALGSLTGLVALGGSAFAAAPTAPTAPTAPSASFRAPPAPEGAPPEDGSFHPSPEARRLMRFVRLHQRELSPDPEDLLEDSGYAGPRAPVEFARGENPVKVRHPVVLAHGAVWIDALGVDMLKSGDYWQGVVERFWELGIPTIAPTVSPAGTIQERAVALKQAIDEAFPKGKVHIIAHSMGGLDARYMITMLGMGHRVKTLTTLSTPHHGSWYADFAEKFILKGQGLHHIARKAKLNVGALHDLSVAHLQNNFNPTVTDHPRVQYFSYAGITDLWHLPLPQWGAKLVVSVAERTAAGRGVGRATQYALNKAIPGARDNTLALIQHAHDRLSWIDPAVAGESDGVVSVSSAKWGTYLGEIRAAHLAQIGTSRRVDHIAVWETLVRNLSAMGY